MDDTSTSSRWRRRKDARPREVLQAALELFVERGYSATRLDDVARRAGVTKGTLYLYFPNKEELFKAVVRGTLIAELDRFIDSWAASPAPPLASVIDHFQRLADSPLGALPKLVLSEAANFPEIARFYRDEVVARGVAALRAMLQRGIDSGTIRPVDTEHVAYCIVAPLLLALLWKHSLGQATDRQLDLATLCRAHLDLLLNGLRPHMASAVGGASGGP